MKKEDLLQLLDSFTDSKPGRELDLSRPFAVAGRSYASNGAAIIRVPLVEEVARWEAKLAEITVALGLDDPAPGPWYELPQYDPLVLEVCDFCKGSGLAGTCPECDGEGEVGWSSTYNFYEATCLSCDGSGKVPSPGKGDTCPSCEGSGKVPVDIFENVLIEGHRFAKGQLDLIKDLQGLEVSIRPHEDGAMLLFRCTVGDGLIMGLRP